MLHCSPDTGCSQPEQHKQVMGALFKCITTKLATAAKITLFHSSGAMNVSFLMGSLEVRLVRAPWWEPFVLVNRKVLVELNHEGTVSGVNEPCPSGKWENCWGK